MDYAESGPTSYRPSGDVRNDCSATTWAEVKEATKMPVRTEDEEKELAENAIVDEYAHVDEYTWPPLHLSRDSAGGPD